MGSILFTTVIRGAGDHEIHGLIYELDLESGRVLKKVPVPKQPFVYGARGGSRGGRGIALRGDEILVAVFDRILIYDRNLQLKGDISSPYVVGHHEIFVDPDGIWCCSTLIDALVKLDFNGRIIDEWCASGDSWFAEAAGGRVVSRNPEGNYVALAEKDDSLLGDQYHFNQIFRHENRMYAYSCNRSILVQFQPEKRIVRRNRTWASAHNPYFIGSRLIINNTRQKRLEIYPKAPPQTGGDHDEAPLATVVIDATSGQANQFATSGWVRGLAILDENHVVVGTSPAEVCLVDLARGAIERRYPVSNDVNEAVHGICLLPER